MKNQFHFIYSQSVFNWLKKRVKKSSSIVVIKAIKLTKQKLYKVIVSTLLQFIMGKKPASVHVNRDMV